MQSAGSTGTLANGNGGSNASGGISGNSASGGNTGSPVTSGVGDGGADAGPRDAIAAPQIDAVGAMCPAFTACGGDLVGTWYLKSECPRAAAVSSICPETVYAVDLSGFTASYTFEDGGTFDVSLSGTITESVRYSATCLAGDAGAVQSCADFEQSIQQAWKGVVDADASTVQLGDFHCTAPSNEGCACDASITYAQLEETGTYGIEGTQVMLTVLTASPGIGFGTTDGGVGSPADYCVSGNTLTIRSNASTNPSVATLTR